jgi:hypothetical protein
MFYYKIMGSCACKPKNCEVLNNTNSLLTRPHIKPLSIYITTPRSAYLDDVPTLFVVREANPILEETIKSPLLN